MGNLVPGLLSFPFAVAGALLWKPDSPLDSMPLVLLGLFPVVGWISLSAFGLWSNAGMRDELGKKFGRERGRPDTEMQFVGFASPFYKSLLDPHEDIGFLILHSDELEIFGERQTVRIPRARITGIRLKKNTHSWVGLGGWVVVESPEQTVLIESRERDTLVGNRGQRAKFKAKLDSWQQNENSPVKSPKEI